MKLMKQFKTLLVKIQMWSCEIQIVMINDKNKVKDISKILDHPFFKNI